MSSSTVLNDNGETSVAAVFFVVCGASSKRIKRSDISRQGMDLCSIAQQHVDAFEEHMEALHGAITPNMTDFIVDFVIGDLEEMVEATPERELTLLSDPEYARKYVLRWGAKAADFMSDDVLNGLAKDFSDIIADFHRKWTAAKAYDAVIKQQDETQDDSASRDDDLPSDAGNVKAYLQRACALFADFLQSGDVFPPVTFSLGELISFMRNEHYLEETFDAIKSANGPRLLQLMLQDIPQHASKRRPASIALAEDTMTELLKDFQSSPHISHELSMVDAFLKAASERDGKDKDLSSEEEETEESFKETCDYFLSCLGFAPAPRHVRRYDFEDFIRDDRWYLGEKAIAIRENNWTEFGRLMSLWMQDQDEFLTRLVPLADLQSDCKLLLQEFHSFTNLDQPTYTLPTSDIALGTFFETGSNGHRDGGSVFSTNYHTIDLEKYRNGHPELSDAQPKVSQNVDFYRGASDHPYYRCYIDDFHNVEKYRNIAAATTAKSTWFGNYNRLEAEHSFIQHLFPIQEGRGLSSCSQRLQKHEIATMTDDPAIQERLLRSTETMLDFYGIQLEILADGFRLKRNPATYQQQFRNLNIFSHNNLRITRMCKCLGDLGLEALQHEIVDMFVQECFEFDVIPQDPPSSCDGQRDVDVEQVPPVCHLPNLRNSLENYWVGTIRNEVARECFQERIHQAKVKLFAGTKI